MHARRKSASHAHAGRARYVHSKSLFRQELQDLTNSLQVTHPPTEPDFRPTYGRISSTKSRWASEGRDEHNYHIKYQLDRRA